MRRDTVQRGIGTASLLLCKNILHQLLLLTGIQQGKQLFTNLLARLRYIQNS